MASLDLCFLPWKMGYLTLLGPLGGVPRGRGQQSPFSTSRPLGAEEKPGYRKARGGWLLRAWAISCNYPMSLARSQQSPPARLSTWSGHRLGGTVLGRPIQGHGAGRKACLGSGWARCPGSEGRGSAALWLAAQGQPLPANSKAHI